MRWGKNMWKLASASPAGALVSRAGTLTTISGLTVKPPKFPSCIFLWRRRMRSLWILFVCCPQAPKLANSSNSLCLHPSSWAACAKAWMAVAEIFPSPQSFSILWDKWLFSNHHQAFVFWFLHLLFLICASDLPWFTWNLWLLNV